MTDARQTIHCGSCGHENPPDTEVCAACGASLAAYRSISAAVPEARQPAASSSPSETIPDTPRAREAAPPVERAPVRHASPIGDALARIRERTEEERAEQPAVTAPVDEGAGESAITFAPSGQPGSPSVAAAPREMTVPPVIPSSPQIEQPPPFAATPRPRQTSHRPPGQRDPATPPKRVARQHNDPVPAGPPPHRPGPDRLARASAANLITWGVVLVAFAFILGIALPNSRHQAIGELIVTIATLAGIILFVVGLARKSGARRPANRRPPRRR